MATQERKLSRGEYWVLEAVVEMTMPIWYLSRAELGLALNKSTHGLGLAELLATVTGLLDEGLLEVYHEARDEWGPPDDTEVTDCLRAGADFQDGPILADTVLDDTEPDDIPYRMTAEGAQVWERFARPEWDLYLSFPPCGNDTIEIRCADGDRLERYFSGVEYLGWVPDPETVRRGVLEPWDATYWKRLPKGFYIAFRLKDDRSLTSRSLDDAPRWFTHLRENRWYDWRS